MDTHSLVSVMLGGIAFDLPQNAQPLEKVQANESKTFLLYANQESSKEEVYDVKRYFLMFFDQTVRGLSPGAPVEIRGIKVGEVVKLNLQYDTVTQDFRIPVLVMLEPQRIHSLVTQEGTVISGEKVDEAIDEGILDRGLAKRDQLMVEKGFRAQLKTGNLLTGQLFIDMDYYPEAAPATITEENGYRVFPTISTPLERIMEKVDAILKKVDALPLDKISENINVAINDLKTVFKEFGAISGKVNRETLPRVNESLDKLTTTLEGIDATLGPDSALSYNSREVMDELSMAIRSLRSLLDYLEKNPQALILGKEGDVK